MKNENALKTIWESARSEYSPRALFDGRPRGSVLCWGKFAYATWSSLAPRVDRQLPHLVISPREALPARVPLFVVGAEHPLPGPGSFRAGRMLLDYFDALGRFEVPALDIYLSGGASSLAWIAPSGWDPARLEHRLRELYAKPWPIARLNRARAELCALKGGGAARWLHRLAPEVFKRTRVHLVSDVAPYGPAVIGSGPFWGEGIPHTVVADNADWVESLLKRARAAGPSRVLAQEGARLGDWTGWVAWLEREIAGALRSGKDGWIVLGGEPSVDLKRAPPGSLRRGGRQSQIAAALLSRFAAEISAGRVTVLCGSTDGVDGRSGSSGTLLTPSVARKALRYPEKLGASLRAYDSTAVLKPWGALLEERPGGVNLQDAVLVRVQGG